MDTKETRQFSGLATEIVVAYVGNNAVPREEVATLISDVHTALQKASEGPVGTGCSPAGTRRPRPGLYQAGLHRLPRRREEVQVAQKTFEGRAWNDPGRISRQVGSQERLPIGRTELLSGAFKPRKDNGIGRKASAAETTEGPESTVEKSRPAARRRTIRSKAKAR